MQQQLPEYMVPTALIHLTELPLTLNGKLDRKALPDPKLDNAHEIMAPRNDIETAVRNLWAEVLHKEAQQISIRDDFFRLGGDSIMSIQLISKLRRQLNVKLTVKNKINCRTIEKLSEIIVREQEQTNKELSLQSEQGCLTGDVTLLSIQQWFFAQDFEKPSHWNQSFIVKVPELDIENLKKALQQLSSHHDALRLRYRKEDNQYIQYYKDEANPVVFRSLDIRTLNTENFNDEL